MGALGMAHRKSLGELRGALPARACWVVPEILDHCCKDSGTYCRGLDNTNSMVSCSGYEPGLYLRLMNVLGFSWGIDVNFLSQQENFKLSWLPYLVLMNKVEPLIR